MSHIAPIISLPGPWREYEGQVLVAKPTAEQMVVLDAQRGEKMKKKMKVVEEETIEETTILHG